MYKLTLEWTEGSQSRFQTISSDQPTKAAGIIRIGRDPSQCDVVVQDATNRVSRLHAEIFFNPHLNTFCLRNATGHQEKPNVVFVDEKLILEEEVPLRSGSVIQLRDITLRLTIIEVTQLKTNTASPTQTPVRQGDIKLESSILKRASQDDFDAIVTMFKQFIPEDEQIHFARYLGIQGLWGIGTRQFACLTDRRVADITVGGFGEVTYQDGYLEHINNGVVYQPSKLGLYLLIGVTVAVAIPFFGLPLLALPFLFKGYYRVNKCGLVLAVEEGIPIYIFTNRKLLTRANALYRSFIICREERLNVVENYPIPNQDDNQYSAELTPLSL